MSAHVESMIVCQVLCSVLCFIIISLLFRDPRAPMQSNYISNSTFNKYEEIIIGKIVSILLFLLLEGAYFFFDYISHTPIAVAKQ